ncbi:ribbon-helix-helix domain-containing protein [Polycladidibacter stylochi]|uniref:ribbon-helix-helix domain-containing protein n=1 Tax=Polycladidibacter stylochi TaxID=1807766 RepID=UPI000835A9BD|nr:ribbon-helix-helix domain-containing protein [Pseudovibrio stylochi]
MGSLVKRSISLHGHKTSVALEAEFWQGLEELANLRRLSLAALIKTIDDNRDPLASLSSCIRVTVLKFYHDNRQDLS